MDDGLLIDNGDIGSTRMRAREVGGEVLTGPERRRRWSVEEKLRLSAQRAPERYPLSGALVASGLSRPGATHKGCCVAGYPAYLWQPPGPLILKSRSRIFWKAEGLRWPHHEQFVA
jgi:hypothetical protein